MRGFRNSFMQIFYNYMDILSLHKPRSDRSSVGRSTYEYSTTRVHLLNVEESGNQDCSFWKTEGTFLNFYGLINRHDWKTSGFACFRKIIRGAAIDNSCFPFGQRREVPKVLKNRNSTPLVSFYARVM